MLQHNLSIVLVETSHPGNIGSVARAMKNFGLADLRLVKPKIFPSAEAIAMSSNAQDILDNAVCYDSVAQAIADCHIIYATSARDMAMPIPKVSSKALSQHIATLNLSSDAKIALMFGPERTGLVTHDLQKCNYHITIPTTDYASLNLAQALVVIAYELFEKDIKFANLENNLATQDDMLGLYQHLQSSLVKSGYLDLEQPKYLMARLQRLFGRAHLTSEEVNIMRGILKSFSRERVYE